jgi:hypothetical protein
MTPSPGALKFALVTRDGHDWWNRALPGNEQRRRDKAERESVSVGAEGECCVRAVPATFSVSTGLVFP